MITLNMMLLPYGQGIGRCGVLHGTIHSSPDNKWHVYNITQDDTGAVYYGKIAKTKSGHKNPVDLLLNVMKDIKDGDLQPK